MEGLEDNLEGKRSSHNQDLNALYNMFWLNRIIFGDLIYYPNNGKYKTVCDDMDGHLEYGWWYPKQLIEYLDHLLETTDNFEWFGSEEDKS